MDNNEALNKFKHGATILCLDMPTASSEVGIDMARFSVGPKFKGIKMINPGIHFFHYKCGRSASMPLMNGFFRDFKKSEILVLKWNSESELLEEVKDEDEAERYRIGVRNFDFDSGLAPYSTQLEVPTFNSTESNKISTTEDVFTLWVGNSKFITKGVLDRLGWQPTLQRDLAASNNEFVPKDNKFENKDQTPINNRNDSPQLSKNSNIKGLCFTKITERWWPKGASPQEITEHSHDKSKYLEFLIKSKFANDGALLLAEVQYSFIIFLLGECFEGLEQWKTLLRIISKCEDLILHADTMNYSKFFVDFIELFYFQLKAAPDDFFIDPIASSNFLVPLLKNFFELTNASTCKLVNSYGTKFRQLSESRFNISFNQETTFSVEEFKRKLLEDDGDEDAPVIVDL